MIPALVLLGQTALPAQVTKSLKLAPREYRVTAPLEVSGTNVVLDGGGATLRGSGKGVGIHVGAGQKITIKNLKVIGFRWGIVAEGTKSLTLDGVTSNGNANYPEAATGKIVMDMEGGKEPDYGGGFLLRGVVGGLLTNLDAHAQWNGVTLSGCSKVVLEKSDLSKNDDTGLHLWNSSDNEIRDNRITWIGIGIVRTGQFAHKGGDQAGILLEHDSSRNRFLRNNLVHCVGDGVFLRANELAPMPAADARKQGVKTAGEAPILLPTHPSNDNLFQENDASFAEDANSFESDFCSGNRFENNVAAFSNYGFWLGFSRNTSVKGNLIVGNRTRGIQLDNGWSNTVEGNTFVRDIGSPTAMYFSDEEANAAHPNHGAQNPSGDLRIFSNTFVGFVRPFRFVQTTPATVQSNTFVEAPSVEPDALAEVTGPKPLMVSNEVEVHTSPDFAASRGEFAPSPGWLDTYGGVAISRLDPKAKEAIVEASLTGRFDGEQFELARVTGPATVTFPPRAGAILRVRGAENTAASYLAQYGDRSFAKRKLVQASSHEEVADNANDGDWSTPEKSWRPNDAAGEWWAVDLGADREITSFTVAPSVANPHDFWSKFRIEISKTGLFTGEQLAVVTETDWDKRPGPIRTYRISPLKGRYVRIIGDVGQKSVQLQELGVYGISRD